MNSPFGLVEEQKEAVLSKGYRLFLSGKIVFFSPISWFERGQSQAFLRRNRDFVAILKLFLAFNSLSTTFLTIENFNSIISGKKKMLPILRTSEVLAQSASYFAVKD